MICYSLSATKGFVDGFVGALAADCMLDVIEEPMLKRPLKPPNQLKVSSIR